MANRNAQAARYGRSLEEEGIVRGRAGGHREKTILLRWRATASQTD